MPFMNQFLPLVIVHSLPTNELLSLGFFLDSIEHGTDYQHQTQISRARDGVPVQDARESNTEHDACGHDEGKDDGSKVLNGIKDKELAYRAANAKHEKVQMDFRVLHDKGYSGTKLVRVHQSHKTEDG